MFVRLLAVLVIGAGIWWTVGSVARGYMVASGMVEPGETIYPGELAPPLSEDWVAGAEGIAMLLLGGWLFARSKQLAKRHS